MFRRHIATSARVSAAPLTAAAACTASSALVSSHCAASSSSGYNSGSEDINRLNQYSSTTFTQGRPQTRVVCRQKPVVQSVGERLWVLLKPSTQVGESVLDTFQLMKLFGSIAFPVLVLLWWKGAYLQYPDYWEQQVSGLQNRPTMETDQGKTQKSYFDIIDTLEQKRDAAMARKGY